MLFAIVQIINCQRNQQCATIQVIANSINDIYNDNLSERLLIINNTNDEDLSKKWPVVDNMYDNHPNKRLLVMNNMQLLLAV